MNNSLKQLKSCMDLTAKWRRQAESGLIDLLSSEERKRMVLALCDTIDLMIADARALEEHRHRLESAVDAWEKDHGRKLLDD